MMGGIFGNIANVFRPMAALFSGRDSPVKPLPDFAPAGGAPQSDQNDARANRTRDAGAAATAGTAGVGQGPPSAAHPPVFQQHTYGRTGGLGGPCVLPASAIFDPARVAEDPFLARSPNLLRLLTAPAVTVHPSLRDLAPSLDARGQQQQQQQQKQQQQQQDPKGNAQEPQQEPRSQPTATSAQSILLQPPGRGLLPLVKKKKRQRPLAQAPLLLLGPDSAVPVVLDAGDAGALAPVIAGTHQRLAFATHSPDTGEIVIGSAPATGGYGGPGAAGIHARGGGPGGGPGGVGNGINLMSTGPLSAPPRFTIAADTDPTAYHTGLGMPPHEHPHQHQHPHPHEHQAPPLAPATTAAAVDKPIDVINPHAPISFPSTVTHVEGRSRRHGDAETSEITGKERYEHDASPHLLNHDAPELQKAAECQGCGFRFAAVFSSRHRANCSYCGRMLCSECAAGTYLIPWRVVQNGDFAQHPVCDPCGRHLRRHAAVPALDLAALRRPAYAALGPLRPERLLRLREDTLNLIAIIARPGCPAAAFLLGLVPERYLALLRVPARVSLADLAETRAGGHLVWLGH
jgi:hypothetical protein